MRIINETKHIKEAIDRLADAEANDSEGELLDCVIGLKMNAKETRLWATLAMPTRVKNARPIEPIRIAFDPLGFVFEEFCSPIKSP